MSISANVQLGYLYCVFWKFVIHFFNGFIISFYSLFKPDVKGFS